MKRTGPRSIGFPLLFSALCLAWNGCIFDDYPAGSPQPEMLDRDSGDISPSGSFRMAERPLDLKKIHPSQPVQFWELRFDDASGNLYVGYAFEDSCAFRTVPCPGALSELRAKSGEYSGSVFNQNQFRYFVGWNGNRILVWNDRDATRSFLGRLDSETDALFWAENQGYWGDSTYIREIPAGYEILTDRMDSWCPYRRLRVRLIMHPDGHSEEVARLTVEETDACMVE